MAIKVCNKCKKELNELEYLIWVKKEGDIIICYSCFGDIYEKEIYKKTLF